MEEQGYLELMKYVMEKGFYKKSRTGNNVYSISGASLRFSLKNNTIPLLTTKRVAWKCVKTELLWFLRGETNAKTLADQGNHIWDANGSREYLDSRGFLFRDEGELGPVYGFQWRNWNGTMDQSKTKIDQIADVIENIKKDPFSRRHIVSAWNPEQINEMALPPCHMMFQFIVQPGQEKNYLDCVLTQRSADLPLGVPFNIASYSLLVHMIAEATNLQAGELIHNMGDVHIYENQIPKCQEQISRTPHEFPKLRITEHGKKLLKQGKPEECSADDFKSVGYKPQAKIEFPFSV